MSAQPPSPLTEQVAGSHYKDMPIQPVEYITKNRLGFIEGSVIKYVTRHRAKNGAQDIRKAIHFLEILLHLEYSATTAPTSEQDVALRQYSERAANAAATKSAHCSMCGRYTEKPPLFGPTICVTCAKSAMELMHPKPTP